MTEERKKWEADAGNISNYRDFNRFVYRNGAVNAFLKDEGKFFIIAAKGMGKTLLLSYKRYLLEKKYIVDGNNSCVIFIPSRHPYIGFIENITTTLSMEHINKFEDWEYCKRIWATIIKLSVLSNSEIDVEAFIADLPSRALRQTKILRHIFKGPRSVEYVFNEIVSMSESAITQFMEDVSNSVHAAYCDMNKAVYMFFDRFDNALETSHDSIWQPIQAGLLEAAWDAMRSNHHVKIYLSIRQEAFAAHRSRNLTAISSSVVKIQYSREELRELVNHLVMYYENKETLEEFLEFDTFPNTVVFENECVFDFMFRYSIGRPRDFVLFCDELSKAKDSLYAYEDQRRIKLKEKVREISSNSIIDSLFDELRMLLRCLHTQNRFNDFLTCLQYNVLTYSEMKTICRRFNGSTCSYNCNQCSSDHHPFCDLYNMGLLGIVNTTQEGRVQHFKTPYENMTDGLRSDIAFFLIHPALREYINRLHMSTSKELRYDLFKGILVGVDLEWIERYDDLYIVNRWIAQLKDDNTRHFFEGALEESIKSADWVFNAEKYNRVRKRAYPIYEQRLNDALVNYFATGKIGKLEPISIFVSYAVDNPNHKERVESFVNMLRADMGFNAQMDSSLKEDYPDIDQMMTVGLKMDKVIVVLSESYKKKADDQFGGVWKEFKMIADDLEKHPKKYIFVSFEEYSDAVKERISPIRIGNRWIVDMVRGKPNSYNELVAFIREEKEYPFKELKETPATIRQKPIPPFDVV